ncbi:excalibur calcium-binding domain-containing protein [Streptomyces sp. NPDC050315]|uniref:excalibur calcium-binding domain-containing protein n=1 Tax=Streptomyces sp. NPDC050315 TaxID=3155039 RepID=UPI0034322B5B
MIALVLGGCSSGESPGSTSKTVTSTATVTTRPGSSPPPDHGSPNAPAPQSREGPGSSAPATVRDAAATVEAYFDAINAGDYAQAWALGGKNLGGSYSAFVEGLADTVQDTVQILGVDGGVVSVHLDALQTDGSVRSFAGTYTVADGVITGASIRDVGGSTPEEPGVTPEETGVTPEESGSVPEDSGPSPYYDVCADARDADAAPIHSGEPGYADHLDRDSDGVACEPREP